MTSKRLPPRSDTQADFKRLPDPLDPATLVETHDVDPVTHQPDSKFATPEIEEMTRTGAIGAGF